MISSTLIIFSFINSSASIILFSSIINGITLVAPIFSPFLIGVLLCNVETIISPREFNLNNFSLSIFNTPSLSAKKSTFPSFISSEVATPSPTTRFDNLMAASFS